MGSVGSVGSVLVFILFILEMGEICKGRSVRGLYFGWWKMRIHILNCDGILVGVGV